jgi:CSLREA domain-containing protein
MRVRRRQLVRIFLLALLALACWSGAAAQAALIPVTSSGDAADTSPGNGVCDVGGGECTLRAAIQTANENDDGQDTITVPAGTIDRTTGSATEDASVNGDLDIVHDTSTPAGQADVIITGAGIGSTIIDAHQHDRVLEVVDGAVASISGLTMRGGEPFSAGDGGGIRAAGDLTLDGVELTDNHADDSSCGGLSESGKGTEAPAVVVRNSLITHNSSSFGGGLCELQGGSVDVFDSTISDNTAADPDTFTQGGGAVESGSGTLNFTRSVIENNTANEGGGVDADGGSVPGISFVDSTIRNNRAVVFEPTAFTANALAEGTGANGSGGGISEDGTDGVSVVRSTISGNTAERNGGGFLGVGGAGGAGSGGRVVSFDNSTIDGNSAGDSGGGLFLGGFQASSSDSSFPEDLSLNNVTLNGNVNGQISACGGSAPGTRCVGGTATLTNSIVSGTTPENCVFAPGKGSAQSGGHNIDNGSSCGFGAAGDKPNTDAKLGALQSNGGPTATDALLAGSPAIDAAGGCPPPTVDQRGIARPQGAACDIGAFEAGATPAVATPAAPSPAPCVDKRKFKFRVHHARGTKIVDIKVFINGKRRKHVKGKNLKSVTITKLPQGTFKVRIDALQNRGGKLVSRRTYKGCTKSRPKTQRAHSNRHRRHRHR